MVHLLPLSALVLSSQLLQNVAAIDCKRVVADTIRWDISPLKGDHSVVHVDRDSTADSTNTTYLFNLCEPISREDRQNRGGCKAGAWACAFQETLSDDDDDDKDDKDSSNRSAWSIAGEFSVTDHGGNLDDHQSRLKASKSNADVDKEGILLEYHGGKKDGTDTMMIMELRCPDNEERAAAEDGEGGEATVPKFHSYKAEAVPGKSNKAQEVLRLEWTTIHACEDEADKEDGQKSSSGWGFFTWIIIILFLIVAAYLIFGSWLNYNRHGARGWDLLPHGDTIRDIPYLLKDWGRRVLSTVQGDGRGGYNQI